MIIVEYCQFGNIQNFLRSNRPNFIDQVDYDLDEIDETVVQHSNLNSENW